jgi:hypothetical protein
MEDLVSVVVRCPYNRYRDKPGIVEQIFQVSLTRPGRTYSMQLVHDKTSIPWMSPHSWRV